MQIYLTFTRHAQCNRTVQPKWFCVRNAAVIKAWKDVSEVRDWQHILNILKSVPGYQRGGQQATLKQCCSTEGPNLSHFPRLWSIPWKNAWPHFTVNIAKQKKQYPSLSLSFSMPCKPLNVRVNFSAIRQPIYSLKMIQCSGIKPITVNVDLPLTEPLHFPLTSGFDQLSVNDLWWWFKTGVRQGPGGTSWTSLACLHRSSVSVKGILGYARHYQASEIAIRADCDRVEAVAEIEAEDRPWDPPSLLWSLTPDQDGELHVFDSPKTFRYVILKCI